MVPRENECYSPALKTLCKNITTVSLTHLEKSTNNCFIFPEVQAVFELEGSDLSPYSLGRLC